MEAIEKIISNDNLYKHIKNNSIAEANRYLPCEAILPLASNLK